MKGTLLPLYLGIGLDILWLLLTILYFLWMTGGIKKGRGSMELKEVTAGFLVKDMLRFYQIEDVQLVERQQEGKDSKSIYLSRAGQNSRSVSAAAVMLHEAGHAVQHQNMDRTYFASLLLTKMFRISSLAAVPGLILGLIFHSELLLILCVWVFAISGITVLVKYAADRKASAYALRYIRQKNVLNPEQMEGFRGILAVTDWSGISSVYEPVLMLLAGFLSLLLGFFSAGSRGGKRNSR